MNTMNTKRQGGFFVVSIGVALIALAAAGGLTINAALGQDDDRAARSNRSKWLRIQRTPLPLPGDCCPIAQIQEPLEEGQIH